MTETLILVIFIVGWFILMLGWFTLSSVVLNYFFPENTTLRDDSAADPDSSSADRRDTF